MRRRKCPSSPWSRKARRPSGAASRSSRSRRRPACWCWRSSVGAGGSTGRGPGSSSNPETGSSRSAPRTASPRSRPWSAPQRPHRPLGRSRVSDRGTFVSLPRPRITAMRFAAPRDSMEPITAPGESTEPVAALDRAAATMAKASAEALRGVAEVDRSELWRRDGATSMSSWLAARYGLGWGTARVWVRVAHALERLPRIAAAYAAGGLSWDQLRPLTTFATPETDPRWAEEASGRRPAWLWREARRHHRVRAREAEEARRTRYLRLDWDRERSVLWLEGMLPAEEGTALQAAVHARGESIPPDPGAVDPPGARLADALVDVATGGPEPATVVVHAGAEALAGAEPTRGPWLAETDGGRRLPSEAVRRLACDGRIEWVLEREGRPVGMGRRGRTVSGSLLRVLRHRDGGACRFPGCERKRWLHAHHLVHWAEGGPTTLDNLVLLSHPHHRLIHEGGWRTSGHPARELRFHDPGGRPLRTHPLRQTTAVGARGFP